MSEIDMGYDMSDRTPVQWPINTTLLKQLKQLKARTNHTRMPDFIEEILKQHIDAIGESNTMPGGFSEPRILALESRVDRMENQLHTLTGNGQVTAEATTEEEPEPEPEVEEQIGEAETISFNVLKRLSLGDLKVYAARFGVEEGDRKMIIRSLIRHDELNVTDLPEKKQKTPEPPANEGEKLTCSSCGEEGHRDKRSKLCANRKGRKGETCAKCGGKGHSEDKCKLTDGPVDQTAVPESF